MYPALLLLPLYYFVNLNFSHGRSIKVHLILSYLIFTTLLHEQYFLLLLCGSPPHFGNLTTIMIFKTLLTTLQSKVDCSVSGTLAITEAVVSVLPDLMYKVF